MLHCSGPGPMMISGSIGPEIIIITFLFLDLREKQINDTKDWWKLFSIKFTNFALHGNILYCMVGSTCH